MGIRATMVRRLGARQPFRLEANHRLEPNEWTKLATYPYCLLQTEPADHLIVSVSYISLCAESPIYYLDPKTASGTVA